MTSKTDAPALSEEAESFKHEVWDWKLVLGEGFLSRDPMSRHIVSQRKTRIAF